MHEEIKVKFDRFIEVADRHVSSHPWLVVVVMHEYFRNLYPTDPYIPLAGSNESPMDRISNVLDNCIKMLDSSSGIGTYFEHIPNLMERMQSSGPLKDDKRQKEGETQNVYGKLWDKFDREEYIKEAYQILESRINHDGFNLSSLKGKTLLDMGCGSGRFTIALTMTGAKKVYGIDLGSESIKNGASIAEAANINEITFDTGSVLELPYTDNFFDFVFCNGVLHHTEDLEQGIKELYRVLKRGGESFLYLYADGGLFWYSRKKMPEIMKKIPQSYTMAILELLGMPNNRFLFTDNWYVPIERHVSKQYLEEYLCSTGFSSIKKIVSGRNTDLDSAAVLESPQGKDMWGDGEHRYILKKGI